MESQAEERDQEITSKRSGNVKLTPGRGEGVSEPNVLISWEKGKYLRK